MASSLVASRSVIEGDRGERALLEAATRRGLAGGSEAGMLEIEPTEETGELS